MGKCKFTILVCGTCYYVELELGNGDASGVGVGGGGWGSGVFDWRRRLAFFLVFLVCSLMILKKP